MQGESSDAKESPAYYIVKAALQSKEEGASMSKLMNSSDRATWAIIMGASQKLDDILQFVQFFLSIQMSHV